MSFLLYQMLNSRLALSVVCRAMRYWTQVWRIGFQNQRSRCYLLQHLGKPAVLVGNHTANTQQKAHFNQLIRLADRSRKTMKDPFEAPQGIRSHQVNGLIHRVSGVYNYGQAKLQSPFGLFVKGFVLLIRKAGIPVKIQPNFAYGTKSTST
jgi:hypothetical protein